MANLWLLLASWTLKEVIDNELDEVVDKVRVRFNLRRFDGFSPSMVVSINEKEFLYVPSIQGF